MSLGLILIIVLIIFLVGGFSGRMGGYGYGYGHRGIGVLKGRGGVAGSNLARERVDPVEGGAALGGC